MKCKPVLMILLASLMVAPGILAREAPQKERIEIGAFERAKIGLDYSKRLIRDNRDECAKHMLNYTFQALSDMDLAILGNPNRKVMVEIEIIEAALQIRENASAQNFIDRAYKDARDIQTKELSDDRLRELDRLQNRLNASKTGKSIKKLKN